MLHIPKHADYRPLWRRHHAVGAVSRIAATGGDALHVDIVIVNLVCESFFEHRLDLVGTDGAAFHGEQMIFLIIEFKDPTLD